MGFVIFISVIHIFVGIKTQETLSVHKKLERGSSTLYGIYIGFCPCAEFYKIL